MKKIKSSVIIYFAVTAVLAGAMFFAMRKNDAVSSNNYVKEEDISYFYFPAEYEQGFYQFNEIGSNRNDGAKIEYSGKLLYDTDFCEYTNTLNNLPCAFAGSAYEAAGRLVARYYPDGRLAAVIYYDANSIDEFKYSGKEITSRYLMLKFYDEKGRRAEDIARDCGEEYADDIAASIENSQNYGMTISRLYLVCGCDDLGTYNISVYISEDDREFDRELCQKVELFSAEGIGCGDYLLAVIYSDGADTDNMRIATERAAELLNGGYSDIIDKAEDFKAVAVIDSF